MMLIVFKSIHSNKMVAMVAPIQQDPQVISVLPLCICATKSGTNACCNARDTTDTACNISLSIISAGMNAAAMYIGM